MSRLYSIGAMDQLADALENAEYTKEDVTRLKQFSNLKGLKDVLNNKAEITYPTLRWREENGIIYFNLVSNGMTGEEWIVYFEKLEYRLPNDVKSILRSPKFKPAKAGTEFKIAILKGNLIATANLSNKKIWAKVKALKFTVPNAEISCLLMTNLSSQEIKYLGVPNIITMHKAIKDFNGDPCVLKVSCDGKDIRLSASLYGKSDNKWISGIGFVFLVSQVEPVV